MLNREFGQPLAPKTSNAAIAGANHNATTRDASGQLPENARVVVSFSRPAALSTKWNRLTCRFLRGESHAPRGTGRGSAEASSPVPGLILVENFYPLLTSLDKRPARGGTGGVPEQNRT